LSKDEGILKLLEKYNFQKVWDMKLFIKIDEETGEIIWEEIEFKNA
jgi:hypothetical protein